MRHTVTHLAGVNETADPSKLPHPHETHKYAPTVAFNTTRWMLYEVFTYALHIENTPCIAVGVDPMQHSDSSSNAQSFESF